MDASVWVAITTAHLINLYDSYQGTTLVVPNRAQKRSGFSPGTRNKLRQGLKPKFFVNRAAARLKPCPDTKPFFAGLKPRRFHRGEGHFFYSQRRRFVKPTKCRVELRNEFARIYTRIWTHSSECVANLDLSE